jgi:hypothetical protein
LALAAGKVLVGCAELLCQRYVHVCMQ